MCALFQLVDVFGHVFAPVCRVPMSKVTAGNLVLVEGLDALISKTATVVGRHLDEDMHVFRPLRFQTRR